jgi:hypothetical protein
MSAAHTPGPWHYDFETIYSSQMIASNGNFICDFVNEPNKSDARIIAAAPDLLAALIEMVAGDKEAIDDAQLLGIPFPDEMLATYGKACAAIAKATGGAA